MLPDYIERAELHNPGTLHNRGHDAAARGTFHGWATTAQLLLERCVVAEASSADVRMFCRRRRAREGARRLGGRVVSWKRRPSSCCQFLLLPTFRTLHSCNMSFLGQIGGEGSIGLTHGFCHWAMDMQAAVRRSRDLFSQVERYY